MRLFQKQPAEPDGSAEGRSFKLSPLGLGRFKPSHFSTFSYGSSMTPIDSICCPDYRQYAQNMCAQPFVICETKREKDGRSPSKEQRVRQGQTVPPRTIIQVFALRVFRQTRPLLSGGEQKAMHRKLDNQFCDFEISLIFHLALPLRSKKSSWYADLLQRSVFLPYASPPSVLVLPWQVTLFDQWQALTFWQLTPLDVQGHYVYKTEECLWLSLLLIIRGIWEGIDLSYKNMQRDLFVWFSQWEVHRQALTWGVFQISYFLHADSDSDNFRPIHLQLPSQYFIHTMP